MRQFGPYARFHLPTAVASFATGALAAAGALLAAEQVVLGPTPWERLLVGALFFGGLAGFAINGYRNERWLARRGDVVRVTTLGHRADAAAKAAGGTGIAVRVSAPPPGVAHLVLLWHGGYRLPAVVVNGRLIHQGPEDPEASVVADAVAAAYRAVDPARPDGGLAGG